MEFTAFQINIGGMDFVFNELSFKDPCADVHSGKSRMQDLLQVCKQSRIVGMSRLAIRPDFYEQPLIAGYTVSNWLNDSTVSHTQKNLFQSIVRYPYIQEKDKAIEDRFISSYAHLYDNQESSAEGLAVAYLYNTVGISFCSSETWNTTEVMLKFSEEGFEDQIVRTRHASTVPHIEFHTNWITERLGIRLVITEKESCQKIINLSDDHHGKDLLSALAKKLVRSQYIIGIINSLPFNPYDTDFIRNCYEDGRIEIVLVRTDEGFGLVIQTTGKNLSETKAIAEILRKEFQNAY